MGDKELIEAAQRQAFGRAGESSDTPVKETQARKPDDTSSATNAPTLAPQEEKAFGQSPSQVGRLAGQFGRYKILKLLGEGGMGAVYLAEDPQLDRQVAIKVPFFGDDQGTVLDRFRREAKAIAAIQHPNICPIHEVAEIDGIHYMAMAFIKGKPLTEFVRGKPLPIAAVVVLVRKLALALAEAHQQGVIHRDLKPANIMINERKEPILMDFGLARRAGKPDAQLTQAGQLMGTPGYMAPEQVAGDVEAMGPACDIYSLGVILYELLTGRVPFRGDILKVLCQIAMDQPQPPSELRPQIDSQLNDICLKALAKKADDRFASMTELAKALADYSKSALGAGGALGAGLPTPPVSATEGLPVSEVASGRPTVGQVSRSGDRATTPAATAPARPPRRKLWIALGAAAVVLLGAVILIIQTARGTVEISSPNGKLPDDVTVVLKGGGEELEVGSKDNWTIKVGPRDYEISLRGGNDQFEVKDKRVTVQRFGAEVVTIIRKDSRDDAPASSVARKPAAKSDTDPDRRAAEYVLSIGGAILVKENAQERGIAVPADLPREAFELRFVEFFNNQKVNDAGLAQFKDCKNVTKLNLGATHVSDIGLAHFKECHNLAFLNLNSTNVSDAGLAHFKDCKNLSHLDLSWTNVTDSGLAHIGDCKSLTILNLVNTQVSDVGLAHFKNCKNLTDLILGSTQLSDEGLAHFKDCENLTNLNLGYTNTSNAGVANFKDSQNLVELNMAFTQVSDAGLAHFKDCQNLTYLNLNNTIVSDAGLAHFKDCKKLTNINLDWTHVTNAGLVLEQNHPDVAKLSLNGTQVSEAGLADLAGLPRLELLQLELTRISLRGREEMKAALPKCQITWSETNRTVAESVLDMGGTVEIGSLDKPESLPVKFASDLPAQYFQVRRVSLAGITKPLDDVSKQISWLRFPEFDRLESLDVSGITEVNYSFLVYIHGLQELSLANAGLNDDALAQLPKLSALKRLSLAGNGLRDEGIKHLAVLTNLETLDLRGTKVSAAGIAELQEALPQCKIEWDGGVIEGSQK